MLPHIPGAHHQRTNQPARENSAGLKRIEAENFPPIPTGIIFPVVDDVENFRAHNAGQHHEDAEVPSVIAIDALFLRIADTDPKPKQHTGRDQHAISRKVEIAYLKESRKHSCLDARKSRKESSRK